MKKRILALFMAAFTMVPLTGCGMEDITSQINNITSMFGTSAEEDESQADQTSGQGVSERNLETDEFYVLHNGVYYPAWMDKANYDQTESPDEVVEYDPSKRQLYYSEEEEQNIPTLYLAKGDKLIFSKNTDALDYVTFERYQDLGYTIPIYNIHATTGGTRYYIDLDEDEGGCIMEGSNLETLPNDFVEGQYLTLSNLGRRDITTDLVRSVIHIDGTDSQGNPYDDIDLYSKTITGVVKDETYDLEVYDGTNYNHYLATADMHVFEQMELFKSTDFTALKSNAWEVTIPDYIKTGYYRLYMNAIDSSSYTGLIRIVTGDSYDINDKDSFNEEILTLDEGHKDVSKGCFSYTEDLNEYTFAAEGTLGSVTDEAKIADTQVESNQNTLKEASIQKFNLTFMEGKDCKIEITPTANDAAGDIYVLFGDQLEPLVYDGVYNTYTLETTGDGKCYTLIVSGLWHTYDINLVNVKSTPDEKTLSVFPTYLEAPMGLDEAKAEQTKEPGLESANNFGEILDNSKLSEGKKFIISLKDNFDENSTVSLSVDGKLTDFTKTDKEGEYELTLESFNEESTYEIKTPTENYSLKIK